MLKKYGREKSNTFNHLGYVGTLPLKGAAVLFGLFLVSVLLGLSRLPRFARNDGVSLSLGGFVVFGTIVIYGLLGFGCDDGEVAGVMV